MLVYSWLVTLAFVPSLNVHNADCRNMSNVIKDVWLGSSVP